MNRDFDIGISYQNDIPEQWIDQLASETSQAGLTIQKQSREIGIYASLEWALPTLVITYLAKPFFDAFLKEAGKDSYAALKSGILYLFEQYLGSNPEPRNKRRSQFFSIQFHDIQERSIKCIFPEPVSLDEYSKMLDDLYDLIIEDLESHSHGKLGQMISKVDGYGASYFIEYCPETSRWIAIDTQKEIRSKNS